MNKQTENDYYIELIENCAIEWYSSPYRSMPKELAHVCIVKQHTVKMLIDYIYRHNTMNIMDILQMYRHWMVMGRRRAKLEDDRRNFEISIDVMDDMIDVISSSL